MASFARPSILRQVCAAAPSKRVFSTVPAIRPVASSAVREALPKTLQVAAFHASAKKQILPPPKRMLLGDVVETRRSNFWIGS